ncbi:Uncharacterised protein [Vibrio cholerae]|nr:Uncharacterised protein [Vibrio cholerae]
MFGIGVSKHLIFSSRIGCPALTRLEIHWTEFPAFEWRINPLDKAPLLLFIGY